MRLQMLPLDDDQVSVFAITLFVALLCACIVIGHLLEKNRWINESITALAIVSFFFTPTTTSIPHGPLIEDKNLQFLIE